MAKKAAEMGPDHSMRLEALGKWCDAFSGVLGAASASALNVMNFPERVDDSVLFIFVDFLPGAKSPYTHDIVDAEIVPLSVVRARALAEAAAFPSGEPPAQRLATFERTLAPRPDMIRVLLRDRRFSLSYTTPFVVARNIRHCKHDPLWFEHLQMCVTRPVRPRERP